MPKQLDLLDDISPVPHIPNSVKYVLNPAFRDLLISMMIEEGRDFNTCELCGRHIPDNDFNLHHLKYEGATYFDLRIVCSPCNHAPENVGLA